MRQLMLTGGIKGCGLMIHKGELRNYANPKSIGKNIKDKISDAENTVSEKVDKYGSGASSSSRKSIQPLKYKF